MISESGHTDSIVIADAGLPVPAGVERIDLAYRAGAPAFLDVLDTVRQRLEQVGVEVEFAPHEEFKQKTHQARAVVRTGEFTPFANIILYSGVPF